MDAMVTARVPIEIREQGNSILKSIGSSPTELVNAAYDYVLKTGELPLAGNPPCPDTAARILSEAQRSELLSSLKEMTLPMPDANRSFRELLAEARDDRYAHLS